MKNNVTTLKKIMVIVLSIAMLLTMYAFAEACDHSWQVKAATCTADGMKLCTKCGDTEKIAAKGHSWQTNPATCTTAGAKLCADCGASESIAAKGHSWQTNPATCTTAGAKLCADCGASESIAAKGHSWQTNPATCTTAGAKLCADCGVSETLAAIGHNWQTNPATCTTAGAKLCSNCGESETLAALGHSWQTNAATCTTAGAKLCSNCGESETLAALGHSWQTTAATCTAAGSKVCATCGETETLAALGHSWVITNSTCSEAGVRNCSTCGASESFSKLPHTEVTVSGTAATCTATGLTDGSKCSVCGVTIVEQQEIPASGHDYTSKKVEPTTTSKGYTKYTCTICGDSYKANYTDKLPSEETSAPAVKAEATEVPAAEEWFEGIVTGVEREAVNYESYVAVLQLENEDGTAVETDVLVITAEAEEDGTYGLKNLHLSNELLAELKEDGIEYIHFTVGENVLVIPLVILESEDLGIITADIEQFDGFVISFDINAVNENNETGCQVTTYASAATGEEHNVSDFAIGMVLQINEVEIPVEGATIYTAII